MTLLPALPAVPDVDDINARLDDLVDSHERRDDDFARAANPAFVAQMGKRIQHLALGDNFPRHRRGLRGRKSVIGTDRRQIVERLVRKFYRGVGRGNSFSLSQDATHSATSFPGTTRPAAISARPRATAAENSWRCPGVIKASGGDGIETFVFAILQA
jgi:hypothetical protein